MAGKKGASSRGRGKGNAKASAVPDVYQDMLSEALPSQSQIPERPVKRRRTGRHESQATHLRSPKLPDPDEEEEEEDELQFEDVIKQPGGSDGESNTQAKLLQTAYRDSDEDSEQSDDDWVGFNLDEKPEVDMPRGDLELNITKSTAVQEKATTSRRRPITKVDRVDRLKKHKLHVLCLLSYVDRRNQWCNDLEVQRSLKPLLGDKTLHYLHPSSNLSQFGRAESLKRGLDQAAVLWRIKWTITARGLRRALWAENEEDIQNVSDWGLV